MATGLLGFLIILAPLVIVHEFGHFLFAKLFNIKVLAFSIGFGPRVWHRTIGETDWRVSAIPLGGYVKLLGEDPETELSAEDKKRALNMQAPWKRFFVYLGGPLFNFIWAILVFMVILVLGESQPSPTANRILENSDAERAGFMSGDRILTVDGVKYDRFLEVSNVIKESPKKKLRFEIERPGVSQHIVLEVTPTIEESFSMYGEYKEVGKLDGFENQRLPYFARAPVIGVSSPESFAAKAGLKTGDKIELLNGEKVASYEDFLKRFRTMKTGGEAEIRFLSEPKHDPVTVKWKKSLETKNPSEIWGLYSSELFVSETVPKTPAEKAGLKKGDRLIRVDGTNALSFFDLTRAINKSGREKGELTLEWERSGQVMSALIKPDSSSERGIQMEKVTKFTIGIAPMLTYVAPESIVVRIYNPFMLFYESFKRMLEISWINLVMIGKMVTGSVSIAVLGGPIAIGKLAGESIEMGLMVFLTRMAQLSVGLGILNILPVPVLDGGHILLLGVEAIRRRPLSMRQTAIIHQVGFFLILCLMVFVIKNDIVRLIPIQ